VLLQYGQVERAREVLKCLSSLVIAGVRDRRILLKVWGIDRRALQYDCVSALTATTIASHQLSGGQYVRLRVLLRERSDGEDAFGHDRPSDVFGQLGDPDVAEVAKEFDVLVERTLRDVPY
jgi:hypothetical protein